MDKQDIMYVVLALAIIVVVALVIKPLVTGQAMDLGLPTTTTTQSPGDNMTSAAYVPAANVTIPTTVPTIIIPTPTPQPTWDMSVHNIEFVDPSQYGISFNQELPGGTRFNESQPDTRMTTLATISGRYSGTTRTIYMPYPIWELWYTVEPSGPTGGKDENEESSSTTSTSKLSKTTDSGRSNGDSTGNILEGSYSVTFPQLSIQVMDGDDPNRIVRTIIPPGGIDKDLWAEELDTSTDTSTDKTTTTKSTDDSTTIIKLDPRPWKEKFYEGERKYFFIITAHSLDSYTIQFKVPTRYLVNQTASS
jgi:hypothetical protein